MSCISSNFSSFFLDSLNDPSEFAKYLSNGENKFSPFEDFQVFSSAPQQQQQYCQQQQNFSGSSAYCNNHVHVNNNNASLNNTGNSNNAVIETGIVAASSAAEQNQNNSEIYNPSIDGNNFNQQHVHPPTSQQQQQQQQQQHHYIGHPNTSSFQQNNHQLPLPTHHPQLHQHPPPQQPTHHHQHAAGHAQGYASPMQRWNSANAHHTGAGSAAAAAAAATNQSAADAGAQHFDGSFEFLKYLRHSNDYSSGTSSSSNSADDAAAAAATTAAGAQSATAASLIDLDTSTSMKSRCARKTAALLSSATRAVATLDNNTLDVFDHDDSKHTIFDMQHHITNNSNSNEDSSMDVSNLAFPHSLLNASNSNTSSESAAGGNADFPNAAAASGAPKPLATFTITENFDVHPSHKVEEGIFQHMNKLPPKKKETLKQLGVRFTGQMTLADKSIVVDNFIKFCQEYEITDHRPYLCLNQSGLNKPEQIKFARYLGQGLPSFTLFCIYSNFKNLLCTKRIENYTKDGYNLPYILDKTKRFLSNTTADLKNINQQQSADGLEFSINNNSNQSIVNVDLVKNYGPRALENFLIYENFEVHDTHRIEDGVCTHMTRLPPKKQEILKQFGIQSNQSVTYYEKYIIVENFIKFCNEYKISDHRPFLDLQESGLSKTEQIKFVRYLGQGLPNLTLNKILVAFREIFSLNRTEKITIDGYNLDAILKKKKKNLYNRMHAAVHRENIETFTQHDSDDFST